jgi:hypothetical protein
VARAAVVDDVVIAAGQRGLARRIAIIGRNKVTIAALLRCRRWFFCTQVILLGKKWIEINGLHIQVFYKI